jgi:hypothetical protein
MDLLPSAFMSMFETIWEHWPMRDIKIDTLANTLVQTYISQSADINILITGRF